MSYREPSTAELKQLLTAAKTIAVVGASSDPARPSHGIFGKLVRVGYHAIPVNPGEQVVHEQRAVASLDAIKEPIDIVNVFRRAEATPDVARAAVAVGAKALWLQSGIYSEEAARIASDAGLMVVMDRCIGVDHALLQIPPRR